MSYAIEITVAGDLAYAPLAVRAVRDLEGFPEGPGEEITTLMPALESVLAALLETLAREAEPGHLWMRLEADESLLSIVLGLRPADGSQEPATPLGDRQEEILEQLAASFDDVEGPEPAAPFRLALTRRFRA
jgi:hypothetical protein